MVALWNEVNKEGTPPSFCGNLFYQQNEQLIYHGYSAWKYQLEENEIQGILMFFDRQEGENPLIEEEQIPHWIGFLKTTLDCYFSKSSGHDAAVYKAILDNSSEYIVLVDSDHKVLEFNSIASKRVFEVHKKELKKGDDYHIYLQASNRDINNLAFQRAILGEKFSAQIELTIANKSHWLEYLVFPVYNNSNTLIGICNKAKGISKEKEAHEKLSSLLETFNALINNLNESMVILSNDHCVIQFNTLAKNRIVQNTEKVYGVGDNFLDFFYEGRQDFFLRRFQKALNGELVEFEGAFSSVKGETLWIQSRYIPIYLESGELLGVGLLTKNIHKQKMLQLALH